MKSELAETLNDETEWTKAQQKVGRKVAKDSGKPFKSGLKQNTVKTVVPHPVLNIPAFTFVEDDSMVECRQCHLCDLCSDCQG